MIDKKKIKNSIFWLELDEQTKNDSSLNERIDLFKLVKLSSLQKSVSNFIRIISGRNDIDVVFPVNGRKNYTDGKTVVLSSDIKQGKIDVSVGLALHEGSHCFLTDFSIVNKISNLTNSTIEDPVIGHLYNKYFVTKQRENSVYLYRDILKNIFNVIEDRRIDNYVKKTSPGYIGYYEELYNEYFNSKYIDAAILTKKFKHENFDSYLFYIINMTNPLIKGNELQVLKKVFDLIDIQNIDRLKNTYDSAVLAFEVFDIICTQIEKEGDDKQKMQDNNDDNNLEISTSKKFLQLKRNAEKVYKIIENQKSFLNGQVVKKHITSKLNLFLELVKNSDAEIRDSKFYNEIDRRIIKVPIIILKGTSEHVLNLLKSESIFLQKNTCIVDVEEGIDIGNILGRKLKVRNEEKTDVSIRKTSGKISKRLIHELGYNSDAAVFEKIQTTRIKKATVHISLDISTSMNGAKFSKSIKTIVALIKAATMISNLRIVFSMRTSVMNILKPDSVPLIWIAYDSEKDNFHRFINIIKQVRPHGGTPESLCFEQIKNEIIKFSKTSDTYFINFSDGIPSYTFYDYETSTTYSFDFHVAVNHCKKIMKQFEQENINVLSFFISDGSYNKQQDKEIFSQMYENKSRFINVNDLSQLSFELNKMFITGTKEII